MSSCCGSVCLLVVLGVVLAFGSPVNYISDSLKQTHDSIVQVLELTKVNTGSNPLFTSVIRSINTSCQRKEDLQLINTTLDIYTHIFSSILQHNQHTDTTGTPALLASVSGTEEHRVKTALTKLNNMMEKLKKQLGHLNHNREDLLSKLNKIEVDDPEVQRKALAEYKGVYQAASVIISHTCAPTHSSSAE